jgi:hypothetical protein
MSDHSSSNESPPDVATTPRDDLVETPGTTDLETRGELPEEPPAEALAGTPIPENWSRVGEHWETTPGEARLFAVSATTSADKNSIYVRYIHPSDKKATVLEFDAIEIDSGYVPRPAYETYVTDPSERPDNFATFPLSIPYPGLNTVDDEDAPTTPERRFIWARYHPFLITRTLYLPPDYAP